MILIRGLRRNNGNDELKLLARRGDREQALALAQEAVRLAEGGDALNQQAKYLLGLAEMLRLAERLDEAAECFAEALRLYELKGNTVARDRIRSASVTPALV